jgi:hypothetical protein
MAGLLPTIEPILPVVEVVSVAPEVSGVTLAPYTAGGLGLDTLEVSRQLSALMVPSIPVITTSLPGSWLTLVLRV